MTRRTLTLGLACLLGGLTLTNTADACHRRRGCRQPRSCNNTYSYGGWTPAPCGYQQQQPDYGFTPEGYYPATAPAPQGGPGWSAPPSPPAPYVQPAPPAPVNTAPVAPAPVVPPAPSAG